jgi:hypothetical protein
MFHTKLILLFYENESIFFYMCLVFLYEFRPHKKLADSFTFWFCDLSPNLVIVKHPWGQITTITAFLTKVVKRTFKTN